MVNVSDTATILLVDDEDLVLSLGKALLERQGYSVFTASDGRDAINICRLKDPPVDCALIDLTMPHFSGRDTLLALRAEWPNLPVIITSGYDDDQIHKELGGAIANAVLRKPFRRNVLLETVRTVLKNG